MKNMKRILGLLFVVVLLTSATYSYGQLATLVVGKQTWSASNLDVDHFVDGSPIQEAKTSVEWKQFLESGQPAWCYYNFNATNGSQYGKLYNIHAVLSSKGLAPAGFHVPDNDDWTTLQNFLGGSGKAAELMKSKSGWMNNVNGTNTSGFNALPGGYLHEDLTFSGMSYIAAWWSASNHAANISESNKTGLYSFGLYPTNTSGAAYGFAVRVVKN
jgi:uncharacterized protein (TIGR02145 family)